MLGSFAEKYLYTDPAGSAVKLRMFTEKYVNILYSLLHITPDPEINSLNDLMRNRSFSIKLPRPVLNMLHSLRINGNKAAHGTEITLQNTEGMLKEAYDLSKWLYITYYEGKAENIPCYISPPDLEEIREKEKLEMLKELKLKEIQLEKALKELGEHKERKVYPKSGEQLKFLEQKGFDVADELKFSEEHTRRLLIEEMLTDAGWDVGANGSDTSEVKQELELSGQPTPSGIGYADYVLFEDNGNPLAVIEVKKTSMSVEQGRKQAQLYADSLEKKYSQRPVIFYTNGYDTYIWNDAANEPPRQIYGFYSKDSLQYTLFRNRNAVDLAGIKINDKIAGRLYQEEAVKRVLEKFQSKRRKALIVLATGTGKTRIAVSLCEALTTANRVKRILFLCDRRELRKQAKNVFQQFLPGSPLTVISSRTYEERDKRIYLATYPAMNRYYRNFDTGFFDLIIADESHRSIYKAYKDLFAYFDSLQVGLTATPVDFVNRNTFKVFDCRPGDPTANYSYEDAVTNEPPYLSSFEVFNVTTKFLREGIKYSSLSEKQKEELEEQVADAETIEFESTELDKYIYNADTNRHIIRNLMENGLKLADGSLGKTIVFARNHRHAIALQKVFDELYPQYGGGFCRVIDNYDPRAEQLIDDFKGTGTNPGLTIAISVDMLDTGIDVPEVLNLVFAKPLKSFVKFWQMIGRGTRLKENLFGPGIDKTKFRIFDHWGNFEWFDLHYKPAEPSVSKSLMQKLFEERISFAENALKAFDKQSFETAVSLIRDNLRELDNTDTISVIEHKREIKELLSNGVLAGFSAEAKSKLKNEIAPLMQWINIRGFLAAFAFDLLIARIQNSLLLKSGGLENLKGELFNRLNGLQRNLNQVQAKFDIIQKALSPKFWESVTIAGLEEIRAELRHIMKFREGAEADIITPPSIDIKDEGLQYERHEVKNKGLEMKAYKERVEEVLNRLFERSVTLQKIKSGVPVTEKDIDELISLVLTQNPGVNLKTLQEFYPETAGHLDLAIRRVIGLAPEYLDGQFTKFVRNHPELNATQLRFIQMLKNHISKYGTLKLENLFEAPFTTIHSEGVYGIFSERQADEIIGMVREITAPYGAKPKQTEE